MPAETDNNHHTTCIQWRDADSALLDDWRQLGKKCLANPTLLPDWMRIVASAHNVFDDVALLTQHKDGNLALIAPLLMSHNQQLKLRLRTLNLVANLTGYHNALLASVSTETAVNSIIGHAQKHDAGCVYLAGVDDDSTLGRYLKTSSASQSFLALSDPGESSPYLPLDSSWEELVQSKAKKFRYKLRKRGELLDGAVTMRWLNRVDDCQELLDCIQLIEEHSWKKDAGHAIFDNPIERNYYQLLLPFLAQRNALLANVLYRGDAPIAYNLCCNWDGWVGQLKTSFDSRHADMSPGSLVIDEAIKRAIDVGAHEFDFLGDTDRHKLAWSKHVRTHSNYYLYLTSSWKGSLIGRLKHWRKSFSQTSSDSSEKN